MHGPNCLLNFLMLLCVSTGLCIFWHMLRALFKRFSLKPSEKLVRCEHKIRSIVV